MKKMVLLIFPYRFMGVAVHRLFNYAISLGVSIMPPSQNLHSIGAVLRSKSSKEVNES
jgi:hypothetical protein